MSTAPPFTYASPTAVDVFSTGDVLADTYEVRGLLGSGAMGQVYEAQDLLLKRRVAIKVAKEGVDPAMLRYEAQALAAVRHPSVVTVYAVARHRGREMVVMERVYGVSLETHLARHRVRKQTVPLGEVVELLSAIADGLSAVHRAGIAHRDIKPPNIMLSPGNRIVLMDFGLFLPEAEVASQTNIAGSPEYMAPEAIRNIVEPGAGHLVDIYALGVLGFELLTGEVPYTGELIAEVWDAHLKSPVPDVRKKRPDVPTALAKLLRAMMAKDPRNRPQSADAVRWALSRALSPQPSVEEKLRVLIVDDAPEVARLLTHYVKKEIADAEVRVVGDGDAAIEAFERREPHILLLDLQMPKTNGIEVCMYLKGTHADSRCVIVPVTAGAQDEDLELLAQLGLDRVLMKGPSLAKQVTTLVREVSEQLDR